MRNSRYFKKLPGFQRSPTGREWWLLKRLPKIFLIGTALLLTVGAYLYFDTAVHTEQLKVVYWIPGLLFSYWFFVGAAFIGCIVVIIMKGPAYVADEYQLPKEDPNKERFND